MYDELKAALLAQSLIPMAEYEWSTRPAGEYGTFQIDFMASNDNGDDFHQGEAWEGSIDLYTKGRKPLIWAGIEAILNTYCDGSWYMNLETVDSETRMLHREYVFELEA